MLSSINSRIRRKERVTHGVGGDGFRVAGPHLSWWNVAADEDAASGCLVSSHGCYRNETLEEHMRNLIIVVVVIAAIAAALWYTPQGRSLLQKFGIASADVVTTTDIS